MTWFDKKLTLVKVIKPNINTFIVSCPINVVHNFFITSTYQLSLFSPLFSHLVHIILILPLQLLSSGKF